MKLRDKRGLLISRGAQKILLYAGTFPAAAGYLLNMKGD
jgi:hypothetical protein